MEITKRNMYLALINFAEVGKMTYVTDGEEKEVDSDTLLAFAANEIALLDKKNDYAKNRKSANGDELYDMVEGVLSDEFEPIGDIAAKLTGEDITVSKVSYRLNKLVEAGVAEKNDIKISGSRTVKGYRRITA